MAVKSRGNVTVTFNSVAITNYCSQAELAATIERLETTHFGSTGKETTSGDTEWSLTLSGDWATALDTAVAPEAITTGTARTAVIAFDGGASTVTYTWTSTAEIGDFSVTASIGESIKWSATLALSGAPTRAVA